MEICFIRFHKEAQLPVRKHAHDTGADILMIESGTIAPRETKCIKLGFGIEIPNGHTARLQVRTSIAKEGICIQGCAIDAGYIGEITMILHNISDKSYCWKAGDRLGYIEVYPTQYPRFVEEVSEQRGQGAFGSTGR